MLKIEKGITATGKYKSIILFLRLVNPWAGLDQLRDLCRPSHDGRAAEYHNMVRMVGNVSSRPVVVLVRALCCCPALLHFSQADTRATLARLKPHSLMGTAVIKNWTN